MNKRNIKSAMFLAMILLVLYLVTRYCLSDFYTPEWSARHIFWIVSLIIVFPALFGKIRFSIITLVGYIIGIISGEIFGGFRANVGPQYTHYGWLICILVLIVCSCIGILIERRMVMRGESL